MNSKLRLSVIPVMFIILFLGSIPSQMQGAYAVSGPIGLGFLGQTFPFSTSTAVSADGSVIVGFSENVDVNREAFMWTQGSGMQGLDFLNPNNPSSLARAVSADGTVIVGQSVNVDGNREAFMWTQGSGMQGLGFLDPNNPFAASTATAVSADGSVIVGASNSDAFMWTQGSGMQDLGSLNPNNPISEAFGVSADGSVIVGHSVNVDSDFEAFMWTQGSGIQGLGFLDPNNLFASSIARAVSADGSVIVGTSNNEAFMWTQGTDMQGLGFLDQNSPSSDAFGVSADGSVIVGDSFIDGGSEAFIWTQNTDMQGLGFLDQTPSSSATAVSADGSVIVGHSVNSDVNTEAVLWTVPIDRCADVDCSGGTDQCNVGVCNPANGQCEVQPTNEGSSCNDSNSCNIGETCQTGSCTGGAAPDCSSAGGQCGDASCDAGGAEGNCSILIPTNEGNSCDDGQICTEDDICQSGACTGDLVLQCGDVQNRAFITGTCGITAEPEITTIPDDFINFVPSANMLITYTNTGNAPGEVTAERTVCTNDAGNDHACTVKYSNGGLSFADKTLFPEPGFALLADSIAGGEAFTRDYQVRMEINDPQVVQQDIDDESKQKFVVTASIECSRDEGGNPQQVCPAFSFNENGSCFCEDGSQVGSDDSCIGG